MTASRLCRARHPRGRVGRLVAGAAALGIGIATLTAAPGAAETEPAPAPPVAGVSASMQLPASKFVAITPTRVLDTRIGRPPSRGLARLADETALSVDPIEGTPVASQLGSLGIGGDDVTAVVINTTLVDAGGPGYATVWPTGFGQPNASTNNANSTGQTTPNLVVAPLGLDGKISIFSKNDADYIIDVMGVMVRSTSSSDGRFMSLGPVRHSDTRSPSAHVPGQTRYSANESRIVDLTPVGVPATASAVVLNVTATGSSSPGFVRVWPGGQRPVPGHSNVNVPIAGRATSNQVISGLVDGEIEVFTKMATDLVIDVTGYFTGSGAADATDGLFVPITPGRLLDSRDVAGPNAFTGGDRVGGGSTLRIPVVNRLDIPADGVKAAAFNVTAASPTGPGFATAFPSSASRPDTSSVNFPVAGQVVTNHAITSLGSNGGIDLFARTSTHLVLDVTGYFLDATGTPPTGGVPTKTIRQSTFVPKRLPGGTRPTSAPYDFLFDRGSLLATGSRPAPTQKVAWNACGPLRYALNVDMANDAQIEVLIASIEEVELRSGIDFQFAGVTSAGMNIDDEVILADNFGLPYKYLPPDDDGSGDVDLVIGYSDPSRTSELQGSVIGVGGSLRTGFDGTGRATAARGFAIIDLPDLAENGSSSEIQRITATTTHELGHMMGLGHVDEGSTQRQGLESPGSWNTSVLRDQLMYPSLNVFETGTTFSPGDQLGLWELYNDDEQSCGNTLRMDDERPLVAVEMVIDDIAVHDGDDHDHD